MSSTKSELLEQATALGVTLTSKATKAVIIAAIEAAETAAAQAATQVEEATEESTASDSTAVTALSDYGISVLRGAVPTVWGALVAGLLTWLLPHLPGDVGDALSSLLGSDAVTALLVAVCIAAWIAAARWVEPRLPDWVRRIVLGYAASPTYTTA